MKTLVIHPTDKSTDFLTVIYSELDCTVLRDNISHSKLKKLIKEHDRIVMLGHGTELGLIGHGRFFIGSKDVYLLRKKDIVAIWCNADGFVKKYDLKGFYTGMIISEYEEALMFLNGFKVSDIEISNKLFANSVKESISSDDMLGSMISKYDSVDNSIIDFNKLNLYKR